jgi:intein-encoded DNA endonuclease-like protein
MGKNNKPWSEEKQNYVIQEYQNGRDTMDLAKELNTYNTSIRRVLVRHNIPLVSTADRLRIVKHNPFVDLNDLNTQYWIGYLIADGCVDSKRNCIRLHSKDISILEKYKEFLNAP